MKHRLTNYWSDDEGYYIYTLERLNGNKWELIAEGDSSWASRIAFHYKISMPEQN